jgi:phosphatidylserine/phosphatidylglycerophosphate/cardiolipin synthase-like enzyme
MTGKMKSQNHQSVFCTWSYRNSLPHATRSHFKDLDYFIRILCSSAQSQLFLVAPYLSSPAMKTLRDSIAKSVQNGAWIRLVTGDLESAESLNRRAVRTLVSGREGSIIKSRLRVLTPTRGMPSLLHAKIILCDKRQGYLGSANFSQSAFDKNFELGVALGSSQVRGLERLLNYFESKNLLEDCTDSVLGNHMPS